MLLAEKLSAKIALDDFDIHEEPRMTLAQYAEGWMGGDFERNLPALRPRPNIVRSCASTGYPLSDTWRCVI